MSYDLQLWSKPPIPEPHTLSGFEGWFAPGRKWLALDQDWIVHVSGSYKVLPEDIPKDLTPLLSEIRYLTHLHLEPIHAPDSARKLLFELAEALRAASNGIVDDPQTGLVHLADGPQEIAPVEVEEESLSLLKLSWWFTDRPLLTDEGMLEFVQLLESNLPEAMPRRYGLIEPPQHLYAEVEREHFLSFLRENARRMPIWYTHRPIATVSLSLFDDWGPGRLGFRFNTISVSVDAKMLPDPGWRAKIKAFWRATSHLIQAFYGDVRLLHGYVWGGGTIYYHGQSEQHPVKGCWWRGIPAGPCHAVVLGPPYADMWPAFAKSAEIEKGLAFLDATDWSLRPDVIAEIGGVPKRLAQRDAKRYARIWPFEGPYDN